MSRHLLLTPPSPLAASSPPEGEPVIVVEGVWKRYRRKSHQLSLRHEAARLLAAPFRRAGAAGEAPFWALRDISFTVRQGEAVALVGRNGSGKTTLLRVLSGITSPTRGQVAVRGRFAPLIALGAGFNFERTGRENIFLNAAILGVSPRRTREIVDAIIAFAELGDFIDEPVKRYSSGMITRLGFSIAINVLPDIVFIDEVLAVGDAAFQAKCVARLHEMKAEGRTLILVTHAAGAVRELCERAIWLDRGEQRVDGAAEDVVAEYERVLGVVGEDPEIDAE